MAIDTELNQLVLNEMTPEQYAEAKANGSLSSTEFYLVDDCGDGDQTTGNYIPIPETAEVGQTIRVSAVDENGKPTAWEAVDMASGGGEKPWRYDKYVEFSEDTVGFTLDAFDDGSPFDFTEIEVRAALKNESGGQVWGEITVNVDGTNGNGIAQFLGGTSGVSVTVPNGQYYLISIRGYLDPVSKTVHGIINRKASALYINSSVNLSEATIFQDVNFAYNTTGSVNIWKVPPTKFTNVTSQMAIGAGSSVWVRGR